jgi:RimJ/RimL family protein N-acetyltransferase
MVTQVPPLAPRTIRLETANYLLRTLEPADAAESWRDWLADPDTARQLNAQPARLTLEALRNYIASFNRATAHLLGVFEKDGGRLIGIRAIYINEPRREFLVNVLIGERDARNKGARSETRAAIYRYFFDEMDLETARCTVLATNAPILRVMARGGWIHERTEQRPSPEQGTIELLHFRLPREVWRQNPGD